MTIELFKPRYGVPVVIALVAIIGVAVAINSMRQTSVMREDLERPLLDRALGQAGVVSQELEGPMQISCEKKGPRVKCRAIGSHLYLVAIDANPAVPAFKIEGQRTIDGFARVTKIEGIPEKMSRVEAETYMAVFDGSASIISE